MIIEMCLMSIRTLQVTQRKVSIISGHGALRDRVNEQAAADPGKKSLLPPADLLPPVAIPNISGQAGTTVTAASGSPLPDGSAEAAAVGHPDSIPQPRQGTTNAEQISSCSGLPSGVREYDVSKTNASPIRGAVAADAAAAEISGEEVQDSVVIDVQGGQLLSSCFNILPVDLKVCWLLLSVSTFALFRSTSLLHQFCTWQDLACRIPFECALSWACLQ
jgi:hypothetical protein